MRLNQLGTIAKIALLPIAAVMFAQAASAGTLMTPNFQVQVSRNCGEGSVTCDNVSYTGTNIHTGATIQLKGRTLHTICADGVTPCRFLGYQFRNGEYTYIVTQDGRLIVEQGEQLLLDESGTWQPDSI